jgi:hypothetical protein
MATRDEFLDAAEAERVDVVAVEAAEVNQASFVPQLVRLRDAGADVLVILATLESITVFRDLRTIGWSPSVTGFGWVFDVVSTVARDSMSGAHGLRFSAAQSAPAVREFSRRRQEQGRPDGFDGEAAIVYAIMQLFEESMRRAGTNPTRASWVATMEAIRGYDNGIIPPITYGPGRHIGTEVGQRPGGLAVLSAALRSSSPSEARLVQMSGIVPTMRLSSPRSWRRRPTCLRVSLARHRSSYDPAMDRLRWLGGSPVPACSTRIRSADSTLLRRLLADA